MKEENSPKSSAAKSGQQAAADKAALKSAQSLWAAAKQRLQLAKAKHKSARKQFKEVKREVKQFREKVSELTKLLKRTDEAKEEIGIKKADGSRRSVAKKVRKAPPKRAKKVALKKKRSAKDSGVAKPRVSKPLSEAIKRRNVPERQIGATRRVRSRVSKASAAQETIASPSVQDNSIASSATESVPESDNT